MTSQTRIVLTPVAYTIPWYRRVDWTVVLWVPVGVGIAAFLILCAAKAVRP